MIEEAMTPERAQAIARDVLAELTSGRRRPAEDGEDGRAAEALLNERFPDLSEYDRTAVLFRVSRMLSARATRAARARAGHEGAAPAAASLPEGDMMVAEAITARRQEMGLSLDDLAARIGVAPARMRNFELGHRRVPVALLARIAQVLEVDLGWFSRERTPSDGASEPDTAAAAEAPAEPKAAANPEEPEGERRSSEPDRDELYALYTSLPPGMRRAVVSIMRELIAERQRTASQSRRSA